MRKIQNWYLLLVLVSCITQVVLLSVLMSGVKIEGNLKLFLVLSLVVDFVLVAFATLVMTSTIKEKDYYATYDELQKKVKEANDSFLAYRHANNVLGNHFVIKYFRDHSGFRGMRNQKIYRRKD